MYAIIETGGKQYQVEEGQSIFVEKLNVEEGSKVSFDKVLLVSKDGDIKVGSPVVEGANEHDLRRPGQRLLQLRRQCRGQTRARGLPHLLAALRL